MKHNKELIRILEDWWHDIFSLTHKHTSRRDSHTHTRTFRNSYINKPLLFSAPKAKLWFRSKKRSWQNNTSQNQIAIKKVYFCDSSRSPFSSVPDRLVSLKTDCEKKTERLNPSFCPPEASRHEQYITGAIWKGLSEPGAVKCHNHKQTEWNHASYFR